MYLPVRLYTLGVDTRVYAEPADFQALGLDTLDEGGAVAARTPEQAVRLVALERALGDAYVILARCLGEVPDELPPPLRAAAFEAAQLAAARELA